MSTPYRFRFRTSSALSLCHFITEVSNKKVCPYGVIQFCNKDICARVRGTPEYHIIRLSKPPDTSSMIAAECRQNISLEGIKHNSLRISEFYHQIKPGGAILHPSASCDKIGCSAARIGQIVAAAGSPLLMLSEVTQRLRRSNVAPVSGLGLTTAAALSLQSCMYVCTGGIVGRYASTQFAISRGRIQGQLTEIRIEKVTDQSDSSVTLKLSSQTDQSPPRYNIRPSLVLSPI